ncbi:MAG: NADH-quinone oxidoreductase subunit [Acidobacteriota bacterium]|jgi:NADH-quinone oxidoreductase subunit J|nr:NADH-quinone oxidoreductase subunit [Acidobacteriota bacterium]
MTFSGWEAVFFWIFSVAALIAGLLTIMARNAVHSALFLISSLLSIAALFILLGAEFIAGVQILVYVGGVMVLFLFVIMLVNVGAEERGRERIFHRSGQVGASIVFALLLAGGLVYALNQGYDGLRDRDLKGGGLPEAVQTRRSAEQQKLASSATGTFRITRDTERLGQSLYRYASLPFEIASVLLLVAILGSVMLARTVKQEAAVDDLAPENREGEAS